MAAPQWLFDTDVFSAVVAPFLDPLSRSAVRATSRQARSCVPFVSGRLCVSLPPPRCAQRGDDRCRLPDWCAPAAVTFLALSLRPECGTVRGWTRVRWCVSTVIIPAGLAPNVAEVRFVTVGRARRWASLVAGAFRDAWPSATVVVPTR